MDKRFLRAGLVSLVVGVGLLVWMCSGCTTVHKYLPDIIDTVSKEWPLDDKTPEPAETPEPVASSVYHEIEPTAVWHGEVTVDTSRVGVLIASPSMVAKYIGKAHGDFSTCVEWVRFNHAETGTDATYTQQMMEPHNTVKSADEPYLACPDGASNWTTADDHGNLNGKWYAYLTGYPQKEPGADGTYRGYCWVPAPPVGEWSTWIKWRSSGNRAAHSYVGIVYEREDKRYMLLYHWNQRGDGGSYEVMVPWVGVFGGGE